MLFSWRKASRSKGSGQGGGCRSRFRPLVEMLEACQLPSTLMVTTNADSGAGTLRQAITDSNATPGPNTIDFALAAGAQTIQPLSPLPNITTPVVIDGTTEPGFAGTPLVVLSGALQTVETGLVITGGSSTIKGLVFNGFQTSALDLESGNNIVQGNFFGTSAIGGASSDTSEGTGITIHGDNNTIGGTTTAARNIISGNQTAGIEIAEIGNQLSGLSGSSNVVQGNYIGTDASGTVALPNMDGMVLDHAVDTTIGGTASGAGNVISGNSRFGVLLTVVGVDFGEFNNVVQGNRIGTNAAGTAAVPNGAAGIVFGGGFGDTIGGTTPGAGNLISGNGEFGIVVTSFALTIQGNKIGTDLVGTAALPNGADGIYVIGASGITIGGATPGAGNLISGNGRFGIFLLGLSTAQGMTPSRNNLIQDNIIGLGQGGGALANADDGVALFAGAKFNMIGGTTPGAGNLISGNGRFGVYLNGSDTSGNEIQGNRIGTSASAAFGQGNTLDGIAVFAGPSDNTIGGTTAGVGNIISGNDRDGVFLANAGSGNLVEGNRIGTNGDGTAVVANDGNGMALEAVSGTTIGGTAAGAANIISGNIEGVVLIGAGANGNIVEGNFIGTDPTGTVALANTAFGVDIQGGASGNIVGGTASGAGNTIAFNGGTGMLIGNSASDTTTIGDAVQGNAIYRNGGATMPGIDLGNDGVTPNGSGPNGPNHFQNHPVFTPGNVSIANNQATTAFTFTSLAGSTFRLEFFLNRVSDGTTGGGRFLGAVNVTTDANGEMGSVTPLTPGVTVGTLNTSTNTISITLPVPPGTTMGSLTSTATVLNVGSGQSGTVGDTSEFSTAAGILFPPG